LGGNTVLSYVIELDDGKIYRKPLYLMVKTMVSLLTILISLKYPLKQRSPGWTLPSLLRSSSGLGHWGNRGVSLGDRLFNRWRVYFMENPTKIWMIWGYPHDLEHIITSYNFI
jgi:hypothetical protein